MYGESTNSEMYETYFDDLAKVTRGIGGQRPLQGTGGCFKVSVSLLMPL